MNTLRTLWRRITLFFNFRSPDFDDELDEQETALVRRIESRRQDEQK